MKQFLPPAGHIIFWREIISYFFPAKINLNKLSLGSATHLANSGTAALYRLFLSLKNNQEKNEVIIPSYTCPTVAAAIIKAGLKPVLCDISLEDFSLLENDVKAKSNSKTLAIVQVELFGILPDNSKLKEFTNNNNIYFVGDAAQSFGNYLINSELLNCQKYDFLVFSTGRGKPINLLHGGGLIIVNKNALNVISGENKIPDVSIIENIKIFINIFLYKFFFNPKLYNIPKSLPFLKLGETIFTLDITLERFNVQLDKMINAIVKRYPDIFENRLKHKKQYVKLLSKFSEYLFPIKIGDKNELIRFPVLFRKSEDRNIVLQKLNEIGIGATGLYPHPLNKQQGMEIYNLDQCRNATQIARQILTLPIHEYVKPRDYEMISGVFDRFLKRK